MPRHTGSLRPPDPKVARLIHHRQKARRAKRIQAAAVKSANRTR